MEPITYVLIGIAVLCIAVSIYFTIEGERIKDNTYYCKHYQKEDWNLWEEFIGHVDEFKFEEALWLPSQEHYCATFDYAGRYTITMWNETKLGTTSIHTKDNECVLCGFDSYHSNLLYKLLLERLPLNVRRDMIEDGDYQIIKE